MAPPVINIRVGGLSGVTVAQLALPTQASATSARAWQITADLVARVIGSSGRIGAITVGYGWTSPNASLYVNQLAPASNVNTTSAQDLVLTAQWATADAGNVLRVENCTIQVVEA